MVNKIFNYWLIYQGYHKPYCIIPKTEPNQNNITTELPSTSENTSDVENVSCITNNSNTSPQIGDENHMGVCLVTVILVCSMVLLIFIKRRIKE